MIEDKYKLSKKETQQFLYYAHSGDTGDDISFFSKEYVSLFKYIYEKYDKIEIDNMKIFKYESPDFIIVMDKKIIPIELLDLRDQSVYGVNSRTQKSNLKSLLFRNVYHAKESHCYSGGYNCKIVEKHFKKRFEYRDRVAKLFDGDIQETVYIINSYDSYNEKLKNKVNIYLMNYRINPINCF
jgi:hypothetical protein